MILDFMIIGGVLLREGNLIKLLPSDTAAVPAQTPESMPAAPEPETPRITRVHTSYASQVPGGGIDFHITVHVDMTEFRSWLPERIQAFFGGIAQVLAAKANVEKEGTGA